MPYYYPWFGMNQTHNEMQPKDFIEFIQAWKKFQDEMKPKEEKKPDKKDDWDFWDKFFLFAAFQSSVAVIVTCLILSHIK